MNIPAGIDEQMKALEADIKAEEAKAEGSDDAQEQPATAEEGQGEGEAVKPEEEQAETEGDGEAEAEAVAEPEEDADADKELKLKNKAWAALRNEAKEEKQKREEVERRAQELAERLARLEGRYEATTPKQEAKPAQDAEPDRLMYPDDWQEWNTRRLEKRVDELANVAKQAQQLTTYQSEIRGMEALDSDYISKNPDSNLKGAQEFLINQERQNMKLLRPDLKPEQIEAQIQADKLTLYRTLHQQGRNPAQVVVDLAKAAGFSSKPAATPAPKRNLDKLAENQRKASNLIGGSPAGRSGSRISSDDLLRGMSMDKLVAMSKKDKNLFGSGDS